MSAAASRQRPIATLAICWILLIAGLISVWRLEKQIRFWEQERGPAAETLYMTSGVALRKASMGYQGLLADIYWTRAVQYFGRGRLAHAKSYPLLGPMLRITTDLDPHLLVAYRFGAVFLAEKSPEGAGEPEQALRLVRKGIVANPDYWRFWEDLGFIYYWDLKDYKQAARAFETGGSRPGAFVWMRAMAATVAAQGGDINVSRLLWTEIYKSADTDTIRSSALSHLVAIEAGDQISRLDALLGDYAKKHGHAAGSLHDLVSAGLLRGLPLDPSGVPYVLAPGGKAALSPRSKVDAHLLP